MTDALTATAAANVLNAIATNKLTITPITGAIDPSPSVA
jgi:hypothetical protein